MFKVGDKVTHIYENDGSRMFDNGIVVDIIPEKKSFQKRVVEVQYSNGNMGVYCMEGKQGGDKVYITLRTKLHEVLL